MRSCSPIVPRTSALGAAHARHFALAKVIGRIALQSQRVDAARKVRRGLRLEAATLAALANIGASHQVRAGGHDRLRAILRLGRYPRHKDVACLRDRTLLGGPLRRLVNGDFNRRSGRFAGPTRPKQRSQHDEHCVRRDGSGQGPGFDAGESHPPSLIAERLGLKLNAKTASRISGRLSAKVG